MKSWLAKMLCGNEQKESPSLGGGRWGKKEKHNSKEAYLMHPRSPGLPTARADVVAAGTDSLSAPATCEAGT